MECWLLSCYYLSHYCLNSFLLSRQEFLFLRRLLLDFQKYYSRWKTTAQPWYQKMFHEWGGTHLWLKIKTFLSREITECVSSKKTDLSPVKSNHVKIETQSCPLNTRMSLSSRINTRISLSSQINHMKIDLSITWKSTIDLLFNNHRRNQSGITIVETNQEYVYSVKINLLFNVETNQEYGYSVIVEAHRLFFTSLGYHWIIITKVVYLLENDHGK